MTRRNPKPTDTFVVWSSKRLAKEYNVPMREVTKLLKSLGAQPYTHGKWYWDIEMHTRACLVNSTA